MSGMFRSPRSASADKRRLINPDDHISWSVDVVSLVPKQILNEMAGAEVVSGAIFGKWVCCGFSNGFFYVWQMKTSNLNESLEAPTEIAKFAFPDFATVNKNIEYAKDRDTNNVKQLMALGPSQGDNETVHLYLLFPTTGQLLLQKISRRDLQISAIAIPSRSQSKVSTRIVEEYPLESGEIFDSITCKDQLVVVGTSRGTLFLIKHIAIPSGLHTQKIEMNKLGILDRLFGRNSSTGSYTGPGQSSHVLPLSSNDFLSVSIVSGIIQWTVEEKLAGGQFANFHPKVRLENFANALASETWQLSKILRVALTVDHHFIHAIVEGETQGEMRLFWVVLNMDGELVQAHWLSRFPLPQQVEILGLVTCENDTTYAAFASYEAVILMVLVHDGNFLQEVDLPPRQASGLFPGMMDRDRVTHGCFMIATSGIALRTRYMCISSHPTKRPRLEERGERTGAGISVQTMIAHLRSHFWDFYRNPGADRLLPPSLRQDDDNREQAIIGFAVELQQKGVSSSYSVSVEWHHAYLKMIQDSGIYRCLSHDTKWKIFAVGQELKTFSVIADALLRKYSRADLNWIETLKPTNLGEWYLTVQKTEEESGRKNARIWHDILENSLCVTWEFQEEMAGPTYDITSEYGPLSWISHPNMQKMLRFEMRIWKMAPTSVSPSLVEILVKTALRSFYGSWKENPTDGNKEELAQVQKRAISLLRASNNAMDEVAFDLCIQYEYFEGLCEIALSHERKNDARHYSLDPLLDKIQGRDLLNDKTFPQYVLNWHADMKLYGHVINFGRKCIPDLNFILECNDELRKYGWIAAIRQGHVDQATRYCCENVEQTKGIDSIEWNLSFAKLSNKLAASQKQIIDDRKREIERKLDVVEAQKRLCTEDSQAPLLPPDKLIEIAIEKLNETADVQEQVELAVIALSLCENLATDAAKLENKVKIWTESLLLNGAMWSEWALGYVNCLEYVREEAMSSTVFGLLLSECRKDPNLDKFSYGRNIEIEVIDRVQGDENRENFTRLLRAVASPVETGTGASLMVSSF
jgi:hypothetical protein